MPDLPGQTVVVIGGSAGIGLETARLARAEGADVILTGRDPDRLQRAAADVDAVSTAAFDAGDPAALERFFGDLPNPVDHVMVTAGAPHYGPPLEMAPDEARNGLAGHLMLDLQVARNAVGRVQPAGVARVHGRHGGAPARTGLAIASAATVAMPAMVANLALEVAPDPRQPDRRRASWTLRSRRRCSATIWTRGATSSGRRCRSDGSWDRPTSQRWPFTS